MSIGSTTRGVIVDHERRLTYAAAAAAAVGYLVWLRSVPKSSFDQGAIDVGARDAFYATIAAASLSLLGFIVTAMAILTALSPTERIAFLRKLDVWKKIVDHQMSTVECLGLLGAVSIAALLVPDDAVPKGAFDMVTVALLAASAVRLTAVLILMRKVMLIVHEDQEEADREAAER